MLEEMVSKNEEKRTARSKSHEGIKAIVSVSDLQSILVAAKRWQAREVDEGRDASKLLHHIANAEKVMLKFKRRKELAYKRRVEARAAAEGFEEVAPTVAPTVAPVAGTIAAGEEPRNTLGDAMAAVVGVFKGQPKPSEKPSARRPAKW